MRLVRVKVLRGFCIGSGRDVFPGTVVELPEHEAHVRTQQGKVAPVTEPTPDENPQAATPEKKKKDKNGG